MLWRLINFRIRPINFNSVPIPGRVCLLCVTADFLVFHSFERHYRGVSVKIFMQCWRTACTSVLSYHSSSHVRSRTRCNSCSVRIKRTIIRLGENTRILTYNGYRRTEQLCSLLFVLYSAHRRRKQFKSGEAQTDGALRRPKNFSCAPPLFCGAPPDGRAQQK